MEAGDPFADFAYVLAVSSVLFFALRNVFDSVFTENEALGLDSTFRPPDLTASKLSIPFLQSNDPDPVAKAEQLRERMQIAIEEQDMVGAYNIERELKQLMAESGIRFEADIGAPMAAEWGPPDVKDETSDYKDTTEDRFGPSSQRSEK